MHNVGLILLVCSLAVNVVHCSLKFTLWPNTQKCFKDEVQAHQLIAMEFEISEAPHQEVDFIVSAVKKNEPFSLIHSLDKFAQ